MAGEDFADVLTQNAVYAMTYHHEGLAPIAAAGLAVVTCMDSRLEPLRMLGLQRGDAKILRNAGARVTDDVLRTLVLARALLGVTRVMVIAHTGCRMAQESEEAVHTAVRTAGGPDTRSLAFLVDPDQDRSVRADVQRVRSWPYLVGVPVGGFIFDLESGRLRTVC